MYLFSRWDVYPLWLPAITTSGLTLKTKIVWLKNNWSAGDLRGCFGNQYEEMLFIVKGRHKIRGRRWSNVWRFDRIPASKMLHPTQKPESLLQRAIEASSDSGDLVVDPFAGSGSTGVAARQAGRSFLLGDIDPKMINIARARLGFPLLSDVERHTSQAKYLLDYPNPVDWGIHPEQLHFIHNELRNNVHYDPTSLQIKMGM